jgi:cytochrome c biogenesis protein CcmG, thiol:disulfide interchange protein DsbE
MNCGGRQCAGLQPKQTRNNSNMYLKGIIPGVLAAATLAWAACAQDTFPVLKAGGEVYTNVTITGVTATDVFFSHARGFGNAKLKNLDPELQKSFYFNPASARDAESKQREAEALFRAELADKKKAAAQQAGRAKSQSVAKPGDRKSMNDDRDIVVPQIHAKSFRGQRPPQIMVDNWLTPPPDMNGKFVLVDFWATWCGPCRQSIPHLNELQAKFADRLVVIGLTDEPLEAVRKMKSPKIAYAVGSDTQARTSKAAAVQGIPHAMLIDPQGIVRFEGMPQYLDEKGLAKLIAKYSE